MKRNDSMFQPIIISPILKLVENCNYTCSFCRYANHPPQEASVMSIELCKHILDEVCNYNISKGQKSAVITFHGGEPLLWGKEQFREILRYEKALEKKYEGFFFCNRMQCNAYLLDEEWMEILEAMRMSVGISLDGPIEMNFHYGACGNEKSMERVIKNIHMLQKQGNGSGILSVITQNHFNHAKEYFDFVQENGITNVEFTFCYNPRDGITIDTTKLTEFLCESFDIYYHSDQKIRVRQFEAALMRMYGLKRSGCAYKERCECGSYLCISPSGKVSFCDDYEEGSVKVGDMVEQRLEEIIASTTYQSTKELYLLPSQNACKNCEWKVICGCGCGRKDVGEGAARKSYFCETYKKLYAHIAETVKNDPRLKEENENMIK